MPKHRAQSTTLPLQLPIAPTRIGLCFNEYEAGLEAVLESDNKIDVLLVVRKQTSQFLE